MLAACVALAVSCSASAAAAAETDVVEVPGRVFRGTVIEVRDRVLVRMRLANGDELTILWSDVRSLRRAAGAPPLAVPTPPSWSPPPPPISRWYGGQTLLVDAVAVGAALVALEPVAIPLYLLGAPTVHVVHGHPGRAIGSLLLRAALPVGFAAAFMAAWPSGDSADPKGTGVADNGPPEALVGAFMGAALGVVSAIAIDAAVLAREPIAAAPAKDSPAARAPTVAPLVMLRTAGDAGRTGWIGVGGTF
ncbi:MAG TPA: hypothetical protein VGG39_02900 [Polyangiaceae bacterium]|jgi:hypothetical protein